MGYVYEFEPPQWCGAGHILLIGGTPHIHFGDFVFATNKWTYREGIQEPSVECRQMYLVF